MPSPVQELSYSPKIPIKTEHFTAGKGMPFPYRTITNNSINRNLGNKMLATCGGICYNVCEYPKAMIGRSVVAAFSERVRGWEAPNADNAGVLP